MTDFEAWTTVPDEEAMYDEAPRLRIQLDEALAQLADALDAERKVLGLAAKVIDAARAAANSSSPHSAPVGFVEKMNTLRGAVINFDNGKRK